MTEKMGQSLTEDLDTNARSEARTRDETRDGGPIHTSDLAQDRSPGVDGDRQDTFTATTTDAPPDRGEDGIGTPLLQDTDDYRHRWEVIQTGFVDAPQRAVELADALVAEVIQELAGSFAKERNQLESQWSQGDQVSTEDLRVSLRRYRSFFDRLLMA